MKTKLLLLVGALLSVFLLLRPTGSSAQIRIVDNVYHLTDQEFDDFIKEGVVLVDFWAVWCGPCKQQAPVINEIALEIGQKAKIAKLDVDAGRKTANRYNIRYIPTMIIFKNGEPVANFVGFTDKQTLMDEIDKNQ